MMNDLGLNSRSLILLEILILALRKFTKLPVLRYVGVIMYYVYGSVHAIPITESTDSMIHTILFTIILILCTILVLC